MKVSCYTPKNYAHFRCIGDKCEDNCCHIWRVGIDEVSMEKYKNIKDLEIYQTLQDSIETPSEGRPYFKQTKEDKCYWLDSSGWCMIHRDLGEEYLCSTCRDYPRKIALFRDHIEKSLNLSCPEVVRVLLFDKKTMEFEEQMEECEQCNNHMTKDGHYKSLWNIRVFLISMLQNRNYHLWERLALIALFAEESQKLLDLQKYDQIKRLIGQFTSLDSSRTKQNLSGSFVTSYSLKLNYKDVIDRFTTLADDFFIHPFQRQLMAETSIPMNQRAEDSHKRYQRYLSSYQKENEHIFENYLVLSIFTNFLQTLLSKEISLLDWIGKLFIHYSTLRTYLTEYASQKEILSHEMVVETIYLFHRKVEHSTLTSQLDQLLKDSNVLKPEYFFKIIRD